MFVGYANKRADLFPTPLTALHGAAFSLERVTPKNPCRYSSTFVSDTARVRISAICEVSVSAPTTPNARASNTQTLLLGGVPGEF